MHRTILSLLTLLLLATCAARTAASASPRPNIVIILVDDMGFSDLGCYGSEIDTPNIDELAASGLRFTQFHNYGRCCPTRAALMTGLTPHRVGIGHMTAAPGKPLDIDGPYQGYLNAKCVTLAEVLAEAGYHTLMTGKWHLGSNRRECWPLQRGFERYFGGLSGAFNYFKPGGNRGLTLDNDPVQPDDDFYATDDFTDVACQFITESTQKDDRPFFLYLAYNAPHWPLNSKWAEFEKYRGEYADGWEALMSRRQRKQRELGLFEDEIEPAPHVGPAWNSLGQEQRDDLDAIMAAYAGCVDSIDQNVGKLVKRLDELELRDNTLIFFLSDNGACQEGGRFGKGSAETVKNPPLESTDGVWLGLCWANACNTPFRLYKHFLHEGGANTPLIANWPDGIPASMRGQFVRQPGWIADFMPTCLELAGAAYPEDAPPHEGRSLLPLLTAAAEPIHNDPVYWEHEGNAAVRWGDWKLVRQYKKPWELYNMADDPTEMDDLANVEARRLDEMVSMWESWASANGVSFPERFNMYEYVRRKGVQ